MRITNNMISNNYLRALNGSLERQSKIQEQLADGKAVHRPSDDPIKTIRGMRSNTSLAMNEQYTQNLNDSQAWMESTDGAMSSLDSIMIRVKELVVSADGTKPPDALKAIGLEVDQLINQSITIGNAKIGDRYLFSGQMDKTQPFERKTIKDPTNPNGPGMDVVVYNGDSNKISMQIKPGAINATQDGINVTGSELFGPVKTIYGQPTMEIFNQLIAIKQELMGGPRQAVVNPGIAGAVNVKGTYTGTGVTYYDVRIDSTSGGTSTNNLNTTSPLNTQFLDLPAALSMQVNGTPVAINTATDTMATLLSKIQTAGGLTATQCDPVTGKVTLTGASNFTGSDAASIAFLNNQLKLPTVNLATATSSGDILTTTGLNTTTKPLDQQFSGLPATFNLSVNGNAIVPDIDTTTDTIATLLSKIKAAGAPTLTDVQYDSVTGKITLTGPSTFTSTDTGLTFLNNQLKLPSVNSGTTTSSGNILDPAAPLVGQFSLSTTPFNLILTNGGLSKTVTFDPTLDSLNSFVANINSAGVNANASYDAVSGKFTLQASSGALDFTGSDPAALSFLTDNLHMPSPYAGQVQIASYSTDGGITWQSAGVTQGSKPGDPSTLTLSNGMSLDIAEHTGNKAGGIYSFRAPAGTEDDWLSRVGLANVDAAHSAQLRQHTQLGARMATYEMARNMMEDANVIITDNVSKNTDIDFSTVVVEQKRNENLYNAALSVGAKLMPMSLVDFLK